MQKKIPALLIIFILFVPLCVASGSWFFGIGMHKRAWLSSQDAVSYWTIQDQSGYLLTLTQQAKENPQSIVLYVRNTILAGCINRRHRQIFPQYTFATRSLLGFWPPSDHKLGFLLSKFRRCFSRRWLPCRGEGSTISSVCRRSARQRRFCKR